MVKRQRLREPNNGAPSTSWDSLSWKKIDTENEDLTDLEGGGMFFGLEELDGNAYQLKRQGSSYKLSSKIVSTESTRKLSAKAEKAKRKRESEAAVQFTDVVTAELDAAADPEADKNIRKKSKKETNIDEEIRKQEAKLATLKKEKKEKKLKPSPESSVSAPVKEVVETTSAEHTEKKMWGSIPLCSILVDSLEALGFPVPTPIQTAAVPVICTGKTDVVGAAETGSGKTLAFCLPMVNTLMQNWDEFERARKRSEANCPFALIIVPTRELALQINSVVKQICTSFRHIFRIEIVSIVGGMSEHKQRRQLDGRPVHIVIATPGRLCDLMQDETISAFKNMANMRFLIVDEADRIVEEGHFPELYRVFSRIVDHETKDSELLAKDNSGSALVDENKDDILFNDNDELAGHNIDDLNFPIPEFLAMPTEEELENARKNTKAVPLDEMNEDEIQQTLRKQKKPKNKKQAESVKPKLLIGKLRQTLLFSATALRGHKFQENMRAGKKDVKKAMKLKGLSKEESDQLPEHLKQLLSMVAIRPSIDIIDIISSNGLNTVAKAKAKAQEDSSSKTATRREQAQPTNVASLPKLLSHFQINVPAEEKDLNTYYYLHKNPNHRSLLFVNSIKTARRVDGFLRALGFNCRTIHAQLQQRQRLRALEAFQASPVGILVATDVAARGLDVSKITSVIHYDIARSAQVYIHRSGRTARANLSGTSISMVSPEDYFHHNNICESIGAIPAMPQYSVDSEAIGVLRTRVSLAKQIFTESFVNSQKTKDDAWLHQNANDADLALDDYEITGTRSAQGKEMITKKQLDRKRGELKKLVETPMANATSGISNRKRGFIVFNPFSK